MVKLTKAERQAWDGLPDDKLVSMFRKAFTEWDRRYRANPEQFESEAVHLLRGKPATYGHFASLYFRTLLDKKEA